MYFLAASVTAMAQAHKFQDLEETGEELVALINSSQPEKLRQVIDEHQALFDQHIETKKIVTQILKGKHENYLGLHSQFSSMIFSWLNYDLMVHIMDHSDTSRHPLIHPKLLATVLMLLHLTFPLLCICDYSQYASIVLF